MFGLKNTSICIQRSYLHNESSLTYELSNGPVEKHNVLQGSFYSYSPSYSSLIFFYHNFNRLTVPTFTNYISQWLHLGLTRAYHDSKYIRKILRSLMALPLVPRNWICHQFTAIGLPEEADQSAVLRTIEPFQIYLV